MNPSQYVVPHAGPGGGGAAVRTHFVWAREPLDVSTVISRLLSGSSASVTETPTTPGG
ncbi:hypothetical protein LDL05_08665 [Nonomuraea cavernae]|nr:hypothetical protein [Nonomuraea cavernae]